MLWSKNVKNAKIRVRWYRRGPLCPRCEERQNMGLLWLKLWECQDAVMTMEWGSAVAGCEERQDMGYNEEEWVVVP